MRKPIDRLFVSANTWFQSARSHDDHDEEACVLRDHGSPLQAPLIVKEPAPVLPRLINHADFNVQVYCFLAPKELATMSLVSRASLPEQLKPLSLLFVASIHHEQVKKEKMKRAHRIKNGLIACSFMVFCIVVLTRLKEVCHEDDVQCFNHAASVITDVEIMGAAGIDISLVLACYDWRSPYAQAGQHDRSQNGRIARETLSRFCHANYGGARKGDLVFSACHIHRY